jgi:methyl-accepting chemotaxis protein
MADQSRALKEMTNSAKNISKQIALITRANRDHSQSAASVLSALQEIRNVTAKNSEGAKDTLRGTRTLLDTVEALVADMNGSNGNGIPKRRSKATGA